ncbi:MAG: type II toxin-antitoxin system HicB family antitoxin [Clostridia bacterium]|nr:type II toxin-antitoxin system HicB family antitoxin [Clostridia bacterium]
MRGINVKDYKIEVFVNPEDEGGGYIATIPELGCIGDGMTIQEAIDELTEVANDVIELAVQEGKNIPAPKKNYSYEYSGKLSLRIPKILHRLVAETAEEENCSINQLIQTYVSLGIGNKFGKDNSSMHVSINIESSKKMENVHSSVNKIWESISNNEQIKVPSFYNNTMEN